MYIYKGHDILYDNKLLPGVIWPLPSLFPCLKPIQQHTSFNQGGMGPPIWDVLQDKQ